MTKSEKIRKFLADRSALKLTKLEEEAGIPARTLRDVNAGIDLPEKHWEPLIKVLKKYGWK